MVLGWMAARHNTWILGECMKSRKEFDEDAAETLMHCHYLVDVLEIIHDIREHEKNYGKIATD